MLSSDLLFFVEMGGVCWLIMVVRVLGFDDFFVKSRVVSVVS